MTVLHREQDDKIVIDALLTKLAHIRKVFIEGHLCQGKMAPEDQWALRILQSRERLLKRIFLANWGHGEEQRRAEIELHLQRRDNGDVLRWTGKIHGVGRFGCRACESVPVRGDEGIFMQVPLGRLCRACNGGIQHCMDWAIGDGAVSEAFSDVGGVTVVPGPEIAQESNESDGGAFYRLYLCDNCGAAAAEPCTVVEP